MSDTVTITRQTAYALLRFIADVKNIEARSKCSDAFFRSHFIDRVKSLDAFGLCDELQKAYDKAAENAPERE